MLLLLLRLMLLMLNQCDPSNDNTCTRVNVSWERGNITLKWSVEMMHDGEYADDKHHHHHHYHDDHHYIVASTIIIMPIIIIFIITCFCSSNNLPIFASPSSSAARITSPKSFPN